MGILRTPKRLFVGIPMRSDRLHETLLPKRLALPVFASDPLSSVAYAPMEIFLVLSVAGTIYFHTSLWFAAAVALVMITVVTSYRQTVRAYPSGGGDYEVARVNLGPAGGLTVAGALLMDYVLTVAVSVSAGIDNLGSAVPFVAEHKVSIAIGVIGALALANLRGVRQAGLLFAVPTYAFVVGVLGLVGWGLFRAALGDDLKAPTADYEILPEQTQLTGLALTFLILRAFSSGCAALTGVQAIANGVPSFRPPKSRNAGTTLFLVGITAVTMFAGLVALAVITDMKVAENPESHILIDGAPAGPGYHQDPIIAQVGAAVFGDRSPAFLYLAATTTLILFFAANTAYNGFPVLGSILARDGFLPRQLHQRGDRLAFSNGILVLAGSAALLVYTFDAEPTRLIQLYIIGVFVAFTLGQTGMVRHWTRSLGAEGDHLERRRIIRARAINAIAAVVTGTVLVIVVGTKLAYGGYIVLIAIPLLFAMMKAIRRHYDAVAVELVPPPGGVVLPSNIHAVVLISQLHTPAMRALAYAQASRPTSLVALHVQTDPTVSSALLREWSDREIPVPLTLLHSPYRDVTGPAVNYVREIRRSSPRDVVCVFLPEYVVGRWWEALLHNQFALRLKTRLLFLPGVMVTSVPWQLGSAEQLKSQPAGRDPGEVTFPGQPPVTRG